MRNDLEILSWHEAEPYIKEVNSELTQIINTISPSKDHKFVKARYKFGEDIIKEGELYLPHNNRLLPISSQDLPEQIRKEFLPDQVPMGIPLNKSVEKYVDISESIIPLRVINPGGIIGLFANLSKNDYFVRDKKYWNFIAGSRSLYLLPKISDDRSFNRLKKEFQLDVSKPRGLYDQFELFKGIYNCQNDDNDWYVDVIFFSKKWFDEEIDFVQKWKLFLYERAWDNSRHLRDIQAFNFQISKILDESYLKPNPYIIDILDHLYGMTEGYWPSFFISYDDEAGPVKLLQEVFTSIYRLSKAPLFVKPNHLTRIKNQNSYYSFSIPTLTKFSPKSRKTSRVVDIVELYDVLQRVISYKKYSQQNTDSSYHSIDTWIKNTKFQFFHMDTANEENNFLQPAADLPLFDNNLSDYLKEFPSLEFSSTDSFLRGCIQMTRNNQE